MNRTILGFIIALGLVFVVSFAQQNKKYQQSPTAMLKQQTGCSGSENAQLEFWVGEWTLTWPGDKPQTVAHGSNSVRRILDGCVVEENFTGGDSMPLQGKSVSMWNPQLRKWQQTWVDNSGSYLDFTGEFKDGQMILSREATKTDGNKFLQRMVWKNISKNSLDWSWERSDDGGKTWTVVWPIHYVRTERG